jgi:hypothetical protein
VPSRQGGTELKVAHTVQVYNSVQLYSLGAVQVYNSADCGVPDRSDLGTLRSRAVCKRSYNSAVCQWSDLGL